MPYLQELARDARGARWVESVAADVRFGVRRFRRTPLAAATMVVLLALGIGIDSALFTVLYSAESMPPAGVARDERAIRIRGLERRADARRFEGRALSHPEFLESAARRDRFDGVAAWTRSTVMLDLGGGRVDAGVAAAVVIVASLATWIPARRAATVNPLEALRAE